jgi:hypothetical protein
MIIQMTKRTVYYPAPHFKATDLLGGSRRVRFFPTAVLVTRETFQVTITVTVIRNAAGRGVF